DLTADPQPDDDRGGHENAVPANDDGTDLERNRARRANHERQHTTKDITGLRCLGYVDQPITSGWPARAIQGRAMIASSRATSGRRAIEIVTWLARIGRSSSRRHASVKSLRISLDRFEKL